jgi:MFS family permease
MDRNFRLLWTGQAVSELGSEITAIATPLIVLQMTGSAADAGVIGALVAVTELVGRLPGGLLADRVNRKWLMIGCDLVRALALAVVTVLLAARHASVVALAVCAVVVAAVSVAFNPAQSGLLGRIVPPHERRRAVGRSAVRTNLAIAVGPPIGGLLVGLGPALAFGADAATFLVSGVLIMLISYPAHRAARSSGTRSPGQTWSELTAGVRWVLARRSLLALLAVVAYLNLMGRAVELISTFRLGGGGEGGVHAGLALTAAGCGGVAGGMLTGLILRRLSDRQVLVTSTAVWAAATVVLATGPELLIAPSLFVMVFALPPVSALLAVAVLGDAPDELRGRVSTALSLLAGALTWLGPLLTGFLISSVGVATCGVVLATPLVVALLLLLRRSRGDAVPDQQEADAVV